MELRWLAVTRAVFATASQDRDRKGGVTCVQVDCTAVCARHHSPFGDTAPAKRIAPSGAYPSRPTLPVHSIIIRFLLPPRNKASTMQRTTHPSIHRNEKSDTHTHKKKVFAKTWNENARGKGSPHTHYTAYVSFCLMKKARRWLSCQAQVAPRTRSCTSVHRTTRELVSSDWSRNSASRSCRDSISTRDPKDGRKDGRKEDYPLEHLLPADVLQPSAQILDALLDVGELLLVPALELSGLADGQVEVQPDAVGMVREPAGVALVTGPKADAVLARSTGREREPSLVRALLVHDPVVVVERLVDRDQQCQLVVVAVRVGLLVPLFGFVLACGAAA